MVRFEPRSPVTKTCLRFIADSLFSAMLIVSCRTKWGRSPASPEVKTGEDGGDIYSDSNPLFIEANHPAAADIDVSTIQHRC